MHNRHPSNSSHNLHWNQLLVSCSSCEVLFFVCGVFFIYSAFFQCLVSKLTTQCSNKHKNTHHVNTVYMVKYAIIRKNLLCSVPFMLYWNVCVCLCIISRVWNIHFIILVLLMQVFRFYLKYYIMWSCFCTDARLIIRYE